MGIESRLKALREKKGMSQQDVADHFNESRQWYNAIEKGKVKNIKYDYLKVFAQCYDVSISYLLGNEDKIIEKDSIELSMELEAKDKEIELLKKRIYELQEKIIMLYEKTQQTI